MDPSALSEIPVFEGLHFHRLEELSGWLKRQTHAPGAVILSEGDPPNGLYVLSKGTVEVIKGAEPHAVCLAELQGPSVFGEIGLLTHAPRTATIRARTTVTTGWLDREHFDALLAEDNVTALHFAVNLGRISAQRLIAALEKIAVLADLDLSTKGLPAPFRAAIQELHAFCGHSAHRG
ncbi:MAG: cyclic nucleotide-binding domain-containing protein [Planctomycetes bacterium]|nr:cyclic nucleotide-binding domain-containing protein [Planctomycetota bacterium]